MYWRHFNLTAEPFSLTPDPSFLYLSPVHAEAYAALMMGLRERRGLTTMIGEVGTGKTTLVYSVLSGLGPEIHTAYVSNARLSFDGILRVALRDFGVACDGTHSTQLTDAFNAFLLDCANKGTTAALVIDEAQNLSFETFEDLRLLTNFETYTHKLLQIVLVGQPELDTKLRDPALRQVSERVAVRCVVNPLTRRESRAYLEHRLAAVNGSLDIFTGAALRLLIARSRGIPRSLNILAHNSMLFAYGEAAERVTRRFVAAAVREKEGRGLVRLWRRRMSRTGGEGAGAKRGLLSSFWTLSAAAACGVIVGLAIAGGETLFGNLSTPATPAATSHTPPQPALAVDTRVMVAPSEPQPSERALPVEQPDAAEPAAAPPALEPAAAPAAAIEASPAELAAATIAPPEQAAASPEQPTQPSLASAETGAAAQPTASPTASTSAAPPAEPTTPTETPPPAAPTALAATPQDAPRAAPAPRPVAAKRPAPSPRAVASATAPRPAATPPAAPRQDSTATQDRARVITVPAGSSLSGLLLTVYGQYSSEMIDRVKAANPQVNDPDFIIAGDELRFPDASRAQPTQPAGGQTR